MAGAKVVTALLVVIGALAFASAAGADAPTSPDSGPAAQSLSYRLYVPVVQRAEDPPPYVGPIVALDIPTAGVSARWTVEDRGITTFRGQQYLEEPTSPDRIAWYPQFGRPGFPGSNTTFAGHVNYVHWSRTPFYALESVSIGDAVYVTMGDGTVYTYTVRSKDLVLVEDLDMAQVLSPFLGNHVERLTFISCGGDFFIEPGVGGEYHSRLIVTAQRSIP